MIAGLSRKGISFDFFFLVSVLGGIRIVDFVGGSEGTGVPDSDLEWPLIPLGLITIVDGVRPGRSLGIRGSERSFRSVMFFSSRSALT